MMKKLPLLLTKLIHNRLFMLFCMLFMGLISMQAQVEIQGSVKDNEGTPLIGATVLIKGTTTGTITDIGGAFKIKAPEGASIEIRSVGYVTQVVTVTNNLPALSIVLQADVIGLDQVVVVGYGVQRKSDLTSAITSVKANDFVQGAVKDPGQLLQGKVAGLTITNANGDPTAKVTISLRGISSFKTDQSPLVIIDGVPGDLNSISPQDIVSIDVLKEGSATAIYGTRGTNGVIIVTTKKGQKNTPLEVTYSTYASTQRIYNKPDIMSAADYRAAIVDGRTPNKIDEGASTDWLKEIMRDPMSHVHNLSLTGGAENTVYAASLAYENKEGIFITSGIERYIARFDVTQNFFDNMVSVNAGAVINNSKTNQVYPGGAYLQALVWNPTLPVYDSTGNYTAVGDFELTNPVSMMKEEHNEVLTRTNRIYGNLKVKPIDGLTFSLMVSKDLFNENTGNYQTHKHPSTIINSYNGLASRSASSNRYDILEFTADYTKSIGAHNFAIMGGYSYEYNLYDRFYMQNSSFPMDGFEYYDLGQGASPRDTTNAYPMLMNGNRESWKMAGFVGRFNYNYANKYYFQASVRRDYSSKFGVNHKDGGNFPAFQVGWKLSEEQFIKDISAINFLKLRAGWGKTGIVPDASYKSKTLMQYDQFVYFNGKYTRVLQPSQNPNPDLQWETKYETNIGVDFGVFNNRISGNIDWYNRTSKDILWDYVVPVPPYKTSRLLMNVGEMNSRGFEVMVNLIPVESKQFSWTSTLLYSTNTNKLVTLNNDKFKAATYQENGGLGAPLWNATQRTYAGRELGEFYAYHLVGIRTDKDSVTWLVENSKGETIPIESAKDSSDRKLIGSGLPKFYLGWNNTFKFKNFDLSIVTRGAFGHKVLNQTKMYYANLAKTPNYLHSAFDKVLGNQLPDNLGPQYTDYYIEDGSYYKIDNITLGYNFQIKKNNYIKSARVYVSGSNLYTFTKYTGLDPETETVLNFTGGIAPGIDQREKFPTTRTYTVGINVVF